MRSMYGSSTDSVFEESHFLTKAASILLLRTSVCQWDDLIDGSPEEPSGYLDRLLLPSPRRSAVPPWRKPLIRNLKVSGCRKVKRWSLEEEETLRNGVQRFGKRNWKLILHRYRHIFEEITEVDLKDIWRNVTR